MTSEQVITYLITLASTCGFAVYAGFMISQRRIAKQKEKQLEEWGKDGEETAQIFARPSGDKSDIVRRL